MGNTRVRTVAVKVDVDGHAPLLSETAAAFNAAATWIARVCWDKGITNTNTAHHRVYGETRRRVGLGAQLAVCARAKAMEALKATRKKGSNRCPTFRAQGSIHDDARTYRLLPLDRVSLSILHGRVVCRMLPGSRQRAMLLEDGWAIGGADLVQRNGTRMSWAFYQLRLFLSYQARVAGVAAVLVNPRHTSRTWSPCGFYHKRNRPDRDHFRCLKCGLTAPADHNAARNVAARATVNWPIVLPRLSPPTAIASTSPHALAVGR